MAVVPCPFPITGIEPVRRVLTARVESNGNVVLQWVERKVP